MRKGENSQIKNININLILNTGKTRQIKGTGNLNISERNKNQVQKSN